MIVGELVLPEVIRGMIEASTTRSPAIPFTRSCGSTTARGSVPMRAVPTGWKIVEAILPAPSDSSASV